MSFTTRVEGTDELVEAYNKRAKRAKDPSDAMRAWAQATYTELKGEAYPPERPAQKYVRTGTLRDSWTWHRQGNNAIRIENTAQQRGKYYPVYVVGDAAGHRQAWMHVGRWWTARRKVEQQIDKLIDRLRLSIVELK